MLAHISDRLAIEYEAAGSGTPLVLLHAFPMTNQMWRAQADALSDTFQVISPNLRGFGQSSPSQTPLTLQSAAADVAALLDHLQVNEPVILGGLSMGGYIAFEFARQFPLRLRALILADTKAEADSEEAKTKRDEMIAFARDHSAAEVFDRMQANLFGSSTRDNRLEVIENARRIAATLDAQAIISAIESLRDRADSTAILNQIAAPTLVICGAEDSITPPEGARKMASEIGGARLQIIPQAGHLSNLEQPQQFNDVLHNWLSGLS